MPAASDINPSGAAKDTQPGTKVPEGPSREQPATRNQKEHLRDLSGSAAVELDGSPADMTKGEASDAITEARKAAQ